MKRCCLFVAWQMLIIAVFVKSQSQTAFISVDCGLDSHESPYKDLFTNLPYTTDADLVISGEKGRVDKTVETNYPKPCWNLRSFPKGERNCYEIGVKRDTKYLIRATFVYGNYDGLSVVPSFHLYLGANMWTEVYANDTSKEVIHVTRSQSLNICLVNTGTGTPFINILELRPLDPEAYRIPSGSLKKLFRSYLGRPEGAMIRYPDDVYDRLWYPRLMEKFWRPVTTNRSIDTSHAYNPPERVMVTAVTPVDPDATLAVGWTVEPPNTQCYPYTHFSELQTLGANDRREFDVMLNGAFFHGPILPEPLGTTTVFGELPKQCTDGKCVLELTKTSRSNLPPVLSAIEVYTVMDFPELETNESDVTGIKDVQGAYELRRISWQGDPCAPKQFLWQGLNCNHSDNSTLPTIISLDLSSSSLTGVITDAIQNLANLQQLDLSNNSLSGAIPEFLASMKSLLVINLSGNNLSGSVPQTLAQKKGMKLNVEGNPLLICTTGSCEGKGGGGDHMKDVVVPVTIAVVVACLALIITALLLFFICRRQKRPPRRLVEGPPSTMQDPDALSLAVFSEISL